jgi:hypothetical protein
VYFTGGGPAQASGTLTSGAGAPGESPVTGILTVGGVAALRDDYDCGILVE